MVRGRLCVCLSVPRRILTLLHGPGCNLGKWYGVPSRCADLQSVHGFHCYDNIAPNAKCENSSDCLYSLMCLIVDIRHTGAIVYNAGFIFR